MEPSALSRLTGAFKSISSLLCKHALNFKHSQWFIGLLTNPLALVRHSDMASSSASSSMRPPARRLSLITSWTCIFSFGLACEKRPPQVQMDIPEMQVLKGETRTCGGLFSEANPSCK